MAKSVISEFISIASGEVKPRDSVESRQDFTSLIWHLVTALMAGLVHVP